MSACPHCGGYNGQHGPNCNRSEPWEHDNADLRARVTALEGTVATLREALVRVRAHTGLPPSPTLDLMLGLNASIIRITDTALETP